MNPEGKYVPPYLRGIVQDFDIKTGEYNLILYGDIIPHKLDPELNLRDQLSPPFGDELIKSTDNLNTGSTSIHKNKNVNKLDIEGIIAANGLQHSSLAEVSTLLHNSRIPALLGCISKMPIRR